MPIQTREISPAFTFSPICFLSHPNYPPVTLKMDQLNCNVTFGERLPPGDAGGGRSAPPAVIYMEHRWASPGGMVPSTKALT